MASSLLLNFQGDIQPCLEGLRLLAPDFDYQLNADGLNVTARKRQGCPITVDKQGNEVTIHYSERIHFFRALGLLLERLGAGDSDFTLREDPQFTMNGVMYDVSQGNAVPKIETIKNILRRMAVMGLNMMMLYCEDSYVVPEEPYFGYMRSKYTYDDLKECDVYATHFGIEMIPCMQTLAHLPDVLKWPAYRDIKEDETTLLVGSKRTYEFIENMLRAASAPFATKRIHIGMDEAWRLGMGAYFQKHGLRNRFHIMTDHLTQVLEITETMGLQPMIWGDMFFRATSKSGGYYDLDVEFTPEMLATMPGGMQLVYWDYYNHDEKFYREFIKLHRTLGSEPIFAGGIWNWISYAINWEKTFVTTNAALNACKQEGINEVFATVWGDNGTECNMYATLLGLQLFAEHGYARTLDMDKLKRRFQFCTGACFDDFINIKYLDEVPGTLPGNLNTCNPSKYLMWQDILAGLFDRNIEGLPLANHYAQLAETLSNGIERNGQYSFLFEFLSQVSHVLALKAEMGLKLSAAYHADDRQALQRLAGTQLPDLAKRLHKLHDCHRELWLATYKALGWEIIDMRYSSIRGRVESAIDQITRYLEGRLDRIEELEEKRLYFNGRPGMVSYINYYHSIVSASPIAGQG